MASAYRSFKLNLHKEEDSKLIEYLEELPVMMRHHFFSEALYNYRSILDGKDRRVEAVSENHPEPDASPLQKVRIKT